MSVFIGMDEAGYGPLLGPLVIGRAEFDCVDDEPSLPIRPEPGLRVGDSKELLGRRDGLAAIEAVVLGFHAVVHGALPESLADWLALDIKADSAARLMKQPWYADLDLPLPFAAGPDLVARAWEAAEKGRLLRNARPRSLGLRAMGEAELNEAWSRSGNKHTSLFTTVVELLEDRFDDPATEGQDMRVSIDKLGGRSFYEPMLVGAFPFVPCEILEENRAESRYRMAHQRGATEFRFLMKGDSRCAEIALASMIAKYTREALMKVFNEYWCAQLPGLTPTAGYYEDGRRFLADLEAGGILDAELDARLRRGR